MQPHVREVSLSGEDWVIRAEPSGVSIWKDLLGLHVWVRLLPALRRDRSWVVSARARRDDPFGDPVLTRVASSRADVARTMDDLQSGIQALMSDETATGATDPSAGPNRSTA